jgi:hypothetical protein
MHVLTWRAGYLASAVSGNNTGAALDLRAAQAFGQLRWECGKLGSGTGASAIFTIQESIDGERYNNVATYTATATETGTAQYVGYYPYLRAVVGPVYTATGALGTGTANMYIFYAAGIL